ncbi:MAG: hypothetical protein R3251_04290 [Candidatus Spechtbacterales bacterium]|nr:hypothetical protein [Candidatus Spechtbacterales bacterium]
MGPEGLPQNYGEAGAPEEENVSVDASAEKEEASIEKKEISPEELIAGAENFKELYDAIDEIGDIKGSDGFVYKPEYIKELIDKVRRGEREDGFITRTYELRFKVQDLLKEEESNIPDRENNKENREQISDKKELPSRYGEYKGLAEKTEQIYLQNLQNLYEAMINDLTKEDTGRWVQRGGFHVRAWPELMEEILEKLPTPEDFDQYVQKRTTELEEEWEKLKENKSNETHIEQVRRYGMSSRLKQFQGNKVEKLKEILYR